MGHRLLSVDWRLDHPRIGREEFFGRSSLSGCDAVFLDPLEISYRWTSDIAPGGDGIRRTDPRRDRGFGRTLRAWMGRRRTEAEDLLLKRGGLLVCRLRARGEPLEISSGEEPSERLDRYSWLPTVSLVDRQHQFSFPANGRFLPRHGEDVVFEESGSPFEAYLRRFEGHLVYDAVYQDLLSTPIDRFAIVLARNRVGDVVALEIPFDEGRLILVPPLADVAPSREAIALLEAVEKAASRPAFSSEPDWLPAYSVPAEEGLVDELAGLRERHATLSAKIDEVSDRLREKTRTKRILYTRGRFSLVPAAGDAFRVLGFDVEQTDDVLELRSDEGDALVVVAATEADAIGLPPYRRLLRAVDRSVTEGEGARKGILVVSASRELDPKRRPTQFTPEVLRGCQAQGFCLMTSYQLFKLVQRVLAAAKDADHAALRRLLLECDGEFRQADAA
jgi:hypothetical protein